MEQLPHESFGRRLGRLSRRGGRFLLQSALGAFLETEAGDDAAEVVEDLEKDRNPEKAIKAFYRAYAKARNEALEGVEMNAADRNSVVEVSALCLGAVTTAMSDKTALNNGLKYTWAGGFELPEGYFMGAHDRDDPIARTMNAMDRGNTQVTLQNGTRQHAAEIMQAWTLFAYNNTQTDPYSSQSAYPDIHPALQHASGSYAMSMKADLTWQEMGITEVDTRMQNMGLHATLFNLASHVSVQPQAQEESVMRQVQADFMNRLRTPLA